MGRNTIMHFSSSSFIRYLYLKIGIRPSRYKGLYVCASMNMMEICMKMHFFEYVEMSKDFLIYEMINRKSSSCIC